MRGVPQRVGVAGKVLAVALGVTIALPAVAAGAVGKMTASLTIIRIPDRPCGQLVCAATDHLSVTATVPLSAGDLPDLTGYRIAMRAWGDDTFSDDLLVGPVYIPYKAPSTISPTCIHEDQPATAARSYFYRGSGILKIRGCLRTSRMFGRLNEDNTFPDYGDEIYVGVRLLNPQGGTVSSDETNRVTGRY
jgi:hypothetical protein